MTETAVDWYTTDSTEKKGIIAAEETQEAEFINTKNKPGSLIIRKTFVGNADNATNKEFEFTVTFLKADGITPDDTSSYNYNKTNGETGTIKSGDKIYLKHDESITITDLPEGLQYEVAEKDYSADGYTTASTGKKDTILTGQPQTAVFINTNYKPGSLTIIKTVTGNAGDTNKKFEFTVTLSDTQKTYSYTGFNGGPSGSITGSAIIELANGQSVTIADLPKDISYTVTEKDYASDGYTTASTGDSGTIVTGEGCIAAFTNTRNVSSGGGGGEPVESEKPALTIVKTADKTTAKVGEVITYTIKVTNTGNVVLRNVTVKDSLLSLTRKIAILDVNGEVTFTGTYTVTEADQEKGKVTNVAIADSDQTDPEQDQEEIPVPKEPLDPTEPVDPTEPIDPTLPVDPNNPPLGSGNASGGGGTGDELVDLNGKTPLGGINPNKPGGVLPKTGETSNIGYYVTGLLLLGLGLALRKRMS